MSRLFIHLRGNFKIAESKVGMALRAVRFEAARYGERALPSPILKLAHLIFIIGIVDMLLGAYFGWWNSLWVAIPMCALFWLSVYLIRRGR